jgi:hypothetical protein
MPAHVEIFQDPTTNLRGKLLDAMASTTDGEWVDVAGFDKISLHLVISATATVKICGSNEVGPLNSSHGYQIFPDKTASEIVAIKTPLRWIKARVTANSGTVDLFFEGV